MPVRYEINPEFNLLLYVFEGECTAREYFDLYHAIHNNDSRRHAGMKVLIDLTDGFLELTKTSLQEAKEIIANNNAKKMARDRVAFLTRSSGLVKLRDAFLLVTEELTVELDVFHNLPDTLRWLDLPQSLESFCLEVRHSQKK